MGRWHADAARRAGARVVAVVDRDAGRATALAARHRSARTFGSLDDALSGTSDGASTRVVHVCTPLASHVPVARAAIDAGCHVLVEKPLCEDSASADALFSAAAARRLVVCPVHQFLFQPGALRAAALLPTLGTLRHLEMEVASTGADAAGADRDTVALEILPHGLAFAVRLLGPSIASSGWEIMRASAGEMSIGTVHHETRVSLRISLRGRPPANRLRLVADEGTIELDLFSGFAVVDRTSASRIMKVVRPFRSATTLGAAAAGNLVRRALRAESAYPGLRELVRRFYSAALGKADAPIAADDARAVTAVWSRLRESLTSSAFPVLSARPPLP